MANVMFKRGLKAELSGVGVVDGQLLICTDTREMFTDVGTERIRLGDFQEFATLAELQANTNPSTTALYYVADLNVLAKWDGTEYVQINLDTGATSVEVVGSGNAVTAASYNATTRKLTLTMGETFATRAYVGEIPADKGETIVEYINKKAEETLSAAQGGSTETAASVAQALQNYKDLTDPRLEALEEVDHEHANAEELAKIADGDVAKWNAEIGSAAAIEVMKKDATIVTFKGVEDALAGKQAVGDYATKAEAQGYANTKDEAIAAAQSAADDAQDAVDALAGKVGTVPADKTVVQMISEAQTAATYDDTKVKEDIKANADAIALLNNNAETEGSVDYKIAQAVAAIMENPDETMNSINELVTWVNDHAADALELSNKVEANEDDIAALELLVGETAVATQITDAIASALKIEGVDKYALAADLTAALGRIAAMESKVSGWDDAAAKKHEHANKALLDTYTQTEANLADAVAKKHEHANAAELAKVVDGKVASWDAAAADVATVKGDYLKGADKTELDGKITAEANRADAAEKALGGRLDTLEQIDHTAYVAADATNLQAAKDYADSLVLTWQNF